MSDHELMERLSRGDEQAFAILYERHREWVGFYLGGFCDTEEDREELVQDVFARIHRAAPRYAPTAAFTSWARQIARNTGIDYLRRCERRAAGSQAELPEELHDLRFEPGRAVRSDLVREELRRAIEALPEPQRLAVVMRYFGTMELKEIAWALRCPVGTVKSRIHHALRSIAQELRRRE